MHMGVSQNMGCLLGGPHNKDYSILGSILGSPYLGKLPYHMNYEGILEVPCKDHRGFLWRNVHILVPLDFGKKVSSTE